MVVRGDKRDLDLDEESGDDGDSIEDSENIPDEVEIAEGEDENKGTGWYLQDEERISSISRKRIIEEYTVEVFSSRKKGAGREEYRDSRRKGGDREEVIVFSAP